MQSLEKYFGKYVNILCVDGRTFKGYYVDEYTQPLDNEENEESIGIIPSKEADCGYGLFKHEIKSIELTE